MLFMLAFIIVFVSLKSQFPCELTVLRVTRHLLSGQYKSMAVLGLVSLMFPLQQGARGSRGAKGPTGKSGEKVS